MSSIFTYPRHTKYPQGANKKTLEKREELQVSTNTQQAAPPANPTPPQLRHHSAHPPESRVRKEEEEEEEEEMNHNGLTRSQTR
jgi:hypothetical protein